MVGNKLSLARLSVEQEQDPCREMAKMEGRGGGTEASVLHIPFVPSVVFFFHHLCLTTLHPAHHTGTSMWPKADGCTVQEKDGPVATSCLCLSTSNKLWPIHREGMLMRAAPGRPKELPLCVQGPAECERRKKNEALTPEPRQCDGVSVGEWTAFAAWQ